MAKSETSPVPVAVDVKEEPRNIEPAALLSKTQTLVYPHVTEELKKIGIIAAFIFVILVILAIVIP